MTVKHLTVNKAIKEGITFALEITEVGAAFVGTMVAKGTEYYGVSYQAGSAEELEGDFEFFKSGVLKLNKLVNEGYEKCVPEEKRIMLKEMRIVGGVHPAILAERLGVSLKRWNEIEAGEAKKSLNLDQAYEFYRSTYIKGNKMDYIEWKMGQQKKPLHLGKGERATV